MQEPKDPRYPVGKFTFQPRPTAEDRAGFISKITACPRDLRQAISGLDSTQLDTPYRDGGWTVKQLVHHVFDSHANAYIRFRLALTEDAPRITAYDEGAWAELPDSFSTPVAVSLDLLDGLHLRWVSMLKSMNDEQYERTLDHPESGPLSLDKMLQLYAWHGAHHVAHVTTLRANKNW